MSGCIFWVPGYRASAMIYYEQVAMVTASGVLIGIFGDSWHKAGCADCRRRSIRILCERLREVNQSSVLATRRSGSAKSRIVRIFLDGICGFRNIATQSSWIVPTTTMKRRLALTSRGRSGFLGKPGSMVFRGWYGHSRRCRCPIITSLLHRTPDGRLDNGLRSGSQRSRDDFTKNQSGFLAFAVRSTNGC